MVVVARPHAAGPPPREVRLAEPLVACVHDVREEPGEDEAVVAQLVRVRVRVRVTG